MTQLARLALVMGASGHDSGVIGMNLSAALAVAASLRRCGIQMRQNAAYVCKEIEALSVDPKLAMEIRNVWAGLDEEGAVTINEAHELGEHVHAGASEQQLIAIAQRITGNVREELMNLHTLVTRLDEIAKGDRRSVLYILVAESAVNILKEFNRAQEAIGHIAE